MIEAERRMLLLMAALIAAVRTARIEADEITRDSLRLRAAVWTSLSIAKRVMLRAKQEAQ